MTEEVETQETQEQPPQQVQTPVEPQPPVTPAEPPKTPWYERRIGVLTARNKELEERAQQAENELALRQQAPPQQQQQQQAPTGALPPQEINRRISAEASRIAQAQKFDDDCNAIASAGEKDFKDFNERIGGFAKIGGLQQGPNGVPIAAPGYVSLIEAAQQTGVAHKVLHELGGNLDEAARIMALPPVRQAVEIERIATKLRQPAPVSKAPAPIEPLAATSQAEFDPDAQDVPMDKWIAWREKQLKKRSA